MGTSVLQVDLSETDRELTRFITMRCSNFGMVKSVKLEREPTPFALVEMSTHLEMLELAAEFGGTAFGSSALIHLEQARTTEYSPPHANEGDYP